MLSYTSTHRYKVIAISARMYYVVGMDNDDDSHTLFICNKRINITPETNCYLYQRYLYQRYNKVTTYMEDSLPTENRTSVNALTSAKTALM